MPQNRDVAQKCIQSSDKAKIKEAGQKEMAPVPISFLLQK
jgi:hypothetical protein